MAQASAAELGTELMELLCASNDPDEIETGRVLDLIRAGADLGFDDGRRSCALLRAARLNSLEIAGEVIGRGADVNAANGLGWTPLMEAANEGHAKMAQLLVEAGADIHAFNRDGKTAYGLATGNGFPAVQNILVAAQRELQRREDEAEALAEKFNAALATAHVAQQPVTLLKPLRLRRAEPA